MQTLKLSKITSEDIKIYQALYESSFPDNEKKPFDFMIQKQKEHKMELLKIMKDHEFIGLMITALSNPILLDYFAIVPKYQSCGYGSQALKLLKQYYQKDFFGEIESTLHDDDIDKLKRKQFYIKNGMIAMPFQIELFQVNMEILTSGCYISYDQYRSLLVENFGEYVLKHIHLL